MKTQHFLRLIIFLFFLLPLQLISQYSIEFNGGTHTETGTIACGNIEYECKIKKVGKDYYEFRLRLKPSEYIQFDVGWYLNGKKQIGGGRATEYKNKWTTYPYHWKSVKSPNTKIKFVLSEIAVGRDHIKKYGYRKYWSCDERTGDWVSPGGMENKAFSSKETSNYSNNQFSYYQREQQKQMQRNEDQERFISLRDEAYQLLKNKRYNEAILKFEEAKNFNIQKGNRWSYDIANINDGINQARKTKTLVETKAKYATGPTVESTKKASLLSSEAVYIAMFAKTTEDLKKAIGKMEEAIELTIHDSDKDFYRAEIREYKRKLEKMEEGSDASYLSTSSTSDYSGFTGSAAGDIGGLGAGIASVLALADDVDTETWATIGAIGGAAILVGSAIFVKPKKQTLRLHIENYSINASETGLGEGYNFGLTYFIKNKHGIGLTVGKAYEDDNSSYLANNSLSYFYRVTKKIDVSAGISRKQFTTLYDHYSSGQLLGPRIGLNINFWHFSLNGFYEYYAGENNGLGNINSWGIGIGVGL